MSLPAAPRHTGCHALAAMGAGPGRPAVGGSARLRECQALAGRAALDAARALAAYKHSPAAQHVDSHLIILDRLDLDPSHPGAHCASADAAYTAAKSTPRRCSAAGRLMSSTQVAGLAAGRRARPAPPSSSSSSAPAPASAARSGSGGTPGIACAVWHGFPLFALVTRPRSSSAQHTQVVR